MNNRLNKILKSVEFYVIIYGGTQKCDAPVLVNILMKAKMIIKLLGIIDFLFPESQNEDGQNNRHFFMKVITCDELMHTHSVIVEIQGNDAEKVLAMKDEETGVVHGIWQVELAVNIAGYPDAGGRNIFEGFLHCIKIELVDADFPECSQITDDDRALAATIVPVVVNGKTTPCLLQRKKRN